MTVAIADCVRGMGDFVVGEVTLKVGGRGDEASSVGVSEAREEVA